MRHPYAWLLCRKLAGLPEVDPRPLDERRAAERAAVAARIPTGDGLQVAEHEVPVAGGGITIRSYRVPGDGPLPAHLLLHGGGFITGSIDTVDSLARHYAVQARCLVLSVAYRLAPEHPWPRANEDAYAALLWAAAQPGVDATRLSVGGVSSGATIAAVVALLARDRGGPALRLQLLEIPATDLTQSQPSMSRYASGYVCTRAGLLDGYEQYLPDAARRSDPFASPLFADLAGLPPAVVVTCQYDPLHDDGTAYVRRLREAGVPAEHIEVRGLLHSTNYLPRLRPARRSMARSATALAEALHGGV
ncbi:alpha/beta hydrolase [Jatrophihabitans sp.]|uniref:alpha/beta hydrolase n=1 Tax=Jatrophihabitans sp. TaxID=1932789 RepID=UPI0030C70170|nr:esterase [Jatrophihabitans sp.]